MLCEVQKKGNAGDTQTKRASTNCGYGVVLLTKYDKPGLKTSSFVLSSPDVKLVPY